jgi:hypothetical protein
MTARATRTARKATLGQFVDGAERAHARRLVFIGVFVLLCLVVRVHCVSLVCFHPWSLAVGSQGGSPSAMAGSAPVLFRL